MQVKFGAIVTEGRGKLGGHVFQGNNGRMVLRNPSISKIVSRKFATTRQLSIQDVSSRWRTFSQSFRNSYDVFVKSNPSKFLPTWSGFHHYCHIVSWRKLLGGDNYTLAPNYNPLSSFQSFSVSAFNPPTSILFSWSSLNPSASVFLLFCSPLYPGRYNISKAKLRFIAGFSGATSQSYNFYNNLQFILKSPFTSGFRCRIRICNFSGMDGSFPKTFDFICTIP